MQKEPDRNQRKALGKGLSALLPNRAGTAPALEREQIQLESPDRSTQSEALQNIPIEQIQPNQDQPRESFDLEKLEELSSSIRANGLIQPITVQRTGPEEYRIIAGERRWRACRSAGLTHIPALVRDVEKQQILELALVENIQREDLNAIEIATAFHNLATEHGLSHEQIAERTGKERSTVTNFLRLLKLSPFVRNELVRGSVSVGHARALLNIADNNLQARLCQKVIAEQLSVRTTERLVKGLAQQPEGPNGDNSESRDETVQVDPNVRAALDEMAMALGTRVRLIAKTESAGRLEIEYYSQDDLDRIYSVIVKS